MRISVKSTPRCSQRSSTKNSRKRPREESPAPTSEKKKKGHTKKSTGEKKPENTETNGNMMYEESEVQIEGYNLNEGRKVDKYCWLCHKIGWEQNWNCCCRTYHTDCLQKYYKKFSEKKCCPECQIDAVDGTKFNKCISTEQLREILHDITVRRTTKNKSKNDTFLLWPPSLGNGVITQIIDVGILIDKINGFVPYSKPAEFFSDIKWLYHNYYILYGFDSSLTKASDAIVKEFKKECLDLEACPECYYYMYSTKCPEETDSFVRLCETPHDIVWAQVSGYPYWPAKCLKVVNGNAHVRFFGKHEVSNLPMAQCCWISNENPKLKKAPKSAKYNEAMKELKKYILLYEEKYGRGSFKMYPLQTPYKFIEPTVERPPMVPRNNRELSSTPTDQPRLVVDMSGAGKEYVQQYFKEEISRSCTSTKPCETLAVDMIFTAESVPDCSFNSDLNVPSKITIVQTETNAPGISSIHMVNDTTNNSPRVSAQTGNDDVGAIPSHDEIQQPEVNHVQPAPYIQVAGPSTLSLSSDKNQDCGNGLGNSTTAETASFDYDYNDDEVIILDNPGPTSSNPISHLTPRGNYNATKIMSFLCKHDEKLSAINRNFKHIMENLFVYVWCVSNKAPKAADIISLCLKNAEVLKNQMSKLKEELTDALDHNSAILEVHRLRQALAQKDISLKEEQRKNEEITAQLQEATQNARLVVENLRSSNDNFWDSHSTGNSQTNFDKDRFVAEYNERLEKMRQDFAALEAEKHDYEQLSEQYQKAVSLKEQYVVSETQTDLTFGDIFDSREVQQALEKQRRDFERQQSFEKERECYRNDYGNIDTNFMQTRKIRTAHGKRYTNQTTTLSKQTTSFHIEFEHGASATWDVVNTGKDDSNGYAGFVSELPAPVSNPVTSWFNRENCSQI